MRKFLVILTILLVSASALAQPFDPPLRDKDWASISTVGAVPDTWHDGVAAQEYVRNTGFLNDAGTTCFAHSDNNCNLFTVPGAGAIWEVRVRDGNGAVLSDVSQPSALATVWTDYFLNTAALVHGLSYDAITTLVPGMILAGAGQRDNVTNNVAGLITTNLLYGYDTAGTNWDRIHSGFFPGNFGVTSNGLKVMAGGYFYDLNSALFIREQGDNIDSDAVAVTQSMPYRSTFLHGYDAGGDVWQRAGLVATHADNLANTINGMNVASFNYGWDGTAWDRELVGAVGEKLVGDVYVRPGEDVGNDWRDGFKADTNVYNPAVTAGTAVDDAGTDIVCTSTYVLNLPNWSVFVLNAGGGSADPFNDVDVQISYDGTNWSSETSTACDTLATTVSARCYKGATESAAYVRVIASCDAGDDTTADCWIGGNKN